MDPVSIRLVRAALFWLAVGAALGALMISDALLPGRWRAWFAPTHGHILFVGWFLQFAVGVGYWLLPRKRLPDRPLGYHEGAATAAFIIINVGLLLRLLAEPVGRMGYGNGTVNYVLGASGVLQLAAILIIVYQFWTRAIPRPKRKSD